MWAAFLNKGVKLAFGTDYPVESVSPFRGLYAAVTRRAKVGEQESFPRAEADHGSAVAAYTTGSAFADSRRKKRANWCPGCC